MRAGLVRLRCCGASLDVELEIDDVVAVAALHRESNPGRPRDRLEHGNSFRENAVVALAARGNGLLKAELLDKVACVEIKILRRVRAESSRRPPRHRRDACSIV